MRARDRVGSSRAGEGAARRSVGGRVGQRIKVDMFSGNGVCAV